MKSFIDYIEMSQDYEILNFEINMIFLSDDYNEHNNKKNKGEKKIMKLVDIIQEILQKHVKGINFREWRAGNQIDEQMTDEGFNIKIYFNEENGFIYGGNKYNCGTWMDKMGSSYKAGNKGHPATPRNGADVEIIGLLYYTLIHLYKLNKEGKYPYNDVLLNNGKKLKFKEWSDKIKLNFEKYFFIEKKNSFTSHDNTYKDYISDDNDYRHEAQLRPNIFIPMAIAPELFDKNHGIKFMKLVDEYLIVNNCIGIRTLDYTDKNYNGDYYPDNDSNNYHLAHGLNYHNGPEWIWPAGFYLMSKINFNDLNENIFNIICQKLIPYQKYILNDSWSGLPELTNKDGKLCPGSCNTQAWSISTIIEAVELLKEKQNNFGFDKKFDRKQSKKVTNKKKNKEKEKNNEIIINKSDKKEKKIKKEKKKNKDIEKFVEDKIENKNNIEEKNEIKIEKIENEENININNNNKEESINIIEQEKEKEKENNEIKEENIKEEKTEIKLEENNIEEIREEKNEIKIEVEDKKEEKNAEAEESNIEKLEENNIEEIKIEKNEIKIEEEIKEEDKKEEKNDEDNKKEENKDEEEKIELKEEKEEKEETEIKIEEEKPIEKVKEETVEKEEKENNNNNIEE